MDKDGMFLDRIEQSLYEAWMDGEVTNTFRNHMTEVINEVRDWL